MDAHATLYSHDVTLPIPWCCLVYTQIASSVAANAGDQQTVVMGYALNGEDGRAALRPETAIPRSAGSFRWASTLRRSGR